MKRAICIQGSDVEEYFLHSEIWRKAGMTLLPFDKRIYSARNGDYPRKCLSRIPPHEEILHGSEGLEITRYHDFLVNSFNLTQVLQSLVLMVILVRQVYCPMC